MTDQHHRTRETDEQWMPLPNISAPPPRSRPSAPTPGGSGFTPPPIDLGPLAPSMPAAPPPSQPSPSSGKRRRAVLASVGGVMATAAIGAGILLANQGDDSEEGSDPTFTVPSTTFEPGTTLPDTTQVPPVSPIYGGTLAVGQYLDVELGSGGTIATLEVSLSNGAFDVVAEPLDGQDIVLSYRGADGSIVPWCDGVDVGASGDDEECSFEAGGDVEEEIIITPYGDDPGGGMVRVTADWAQAPPPDPSVLLSGLEMPGWVESGDEPRNDVWTCGGTYEANAFEGHAQHWSSDSGWGASGITMVFETPEAASGYVTTMAETYYSDCTVPLEDGGTFVFDALEVGTDGELFIGYSMYDANGVVSSTGFEFVHSVGPVAIDVSCDGDEADCATLFAYAVERLTQTQN